MNLCTRKTIVSDTRTAYIILEYDKNDNIPRLRLWCRIAGIIYAICLRNNQNNRNTCRIKYQLDTIF